MALNTKGERDLLRTVFDAIPSLIFVVDRDVRIQECNKAASDLLAVARKTFLKKRAGAILHCVHATDVPEGCGRAPHCQSCIVRNSVAEAFQGNHIVRRRAKIEIIRDGANAEIYSLITVSPFSFQGLSHALLVIEDISELAELHRIIPICSVCGKIRDDKESWMRVEAYFKDNWDVDFTHSYCPACYDNERDKLKKSPPGNDPADEDQSGR